MIAPDEVLCELVIVKPEPETKPTEYIFVTLAIPPLALVV